MATTNRTTVSFKNAEQAERLNQMLGPSQINGPSKLLQAIADGTVAPLPWSAELQSALLAAVGALQGQSDPRATSLLNALARLPLSPPNKTEVERLLQRDSGWVAQAKDCIAQQQPFVLHYHNKERLVQYAEIAHQDGREYFHCWISEADDNAELTELAHNRLFWVAEDAHLTPQPEAVWRTEGLDFVEAKFRVAFRYHPKPEDRIVAVEAAQIGGEAWTLVTQRVTNLLWFLQRVARYSSKCVILGPERIREIRLRQLHEEIEAYKQ